MKKMNYCETELNNKIGEACRLARKKRKLSQEGLVTIIESYLADKLKCKGFTLVEAEQYINNKCDKELITKLKKKGIEPYCHKMAVSTISSYENGNSAIPAYYVELLKEIFGDFKF